MRKALLTPLFLAGAALAYGQTATELFDYDAGTPFAGLSGGAGWAGPWTLNTGTDGVVAAGSIDAPTGMSMGTLLEIDNGASGARAETRYERALANPVADEDGNEIYLSYYMSADSLQDDAPQGFLAAGLGFVDTDAFGAGGPQGQTVLVGRFGVNGDVRNWKQGGGVAEQDAEQDDRRTIYEPNFLVTAIFFRGADRTDLTFTWINPTSAALDTSDADIRREMGPALNVINGIGGKVTQQDPLTVRFDDIRVGTTPASVFPGTTLPVSFASFTAAPTHDGVRLAWATASELDNAGFAVERSADADAWTEIGFVAGFGESRQVRTYGFEDGEALAGTRYYRLRQLDYDGTATLSNVVTVVADAAAAGGFALEGAYPTRVAATVVNTAAAAQSFEVFSQAGQRVARFDLGAGERYRLDLADLAAGVYVVRSGAVAKTFVRQ